MDEIFVGVLIVLIIIAFPAMLYDNLRCRHEWVRHTFEADGKIKYCLVCKQCGKVKVLK
jgi:hypothetical protein